MCYSLKINNHSLWLLVIDCEVREKPLQLERTYNRRRTLGKMNTKGKAAGSHPGKYVIRETEYAAAPFCGADMRSRPVTWSITPRHDMFEKCHKPAGNRRRLERVTHRSVRVLVLRSQCNGSSGASVRSPVVDEERIRAVHDFPSLSSTRCFDNVSCITGRTCGL